MTWAELEQRLLRMCDVAAAAAKGGNKKANGAMRGLYQLLGQVRYLAHLAPRGNARAARTIDRHLRRWEALAPAAASINGPGGAA